MTGTGTQTDPYIVSEYSEFMSAIIMSGAYIKCADNTVWDMNEIDPTGEIYHNAQIAMLCKEINGNGAVINNLNTPLNDADVLFLINGVTIKNFKFHNMNLTNGATLFRAYSSSAYFDNCEMSGFLGERARLLMSGGTSDKTINLNRCSITLELYGESQIMYSSIKLTNSSINIPFIADDYKYSSGSFNHMSHCLFTGEFPFFYSEGSISVRSDAGNYNIIDAHIKTKNFNIKLNGTYLVNIDKCDHFDSLSTYNKSILVTSSQLKDAAYLRSQGFPIPIYTS